MKRSAWIVAVCCAVFALGACRTVILEEETPPGSVPPPQPVMMNPSGNSQPPAGQMPTAAPRSSQTAAPRAASSPAPAAEPAATGPSFAEAYERLGSPRMVVFATRTYSGRVNDWQGNSRTTTNHEVSVRDQSPGSTENVKIEAEGSRADLDAVAPVQPVYTDDELLFERSFSAALARAGVAVIDRDVVVRQEALRHQDVDVTTQTVLSEHVVESYALNNNVNIIVTVDMLGSHTLPCIDRRYVATAKRSQTGQILSTADSVGAVNRFSSTRYAATSEGYKQQTATLQYTCSDLAEALALDLLDGLTRSAYQ